MRMNTDKLKMKMLFLGLEGWTNKDIAEKVGVHEMTVSRIMTGRTKQIKPETMNKFAEAFQVEVKELL